MGCLPQLLRRAIVYLSMYPRRLSGPGFVLDGEPQKRHLADARADYSFQRLFEFSDFRGRRVALAPGGIIETDFLYQDRSHDESEDRTPVIPTT